MAQSAHTIHTEISYLVYDKKYQHEKPYRLNYDVGGTIPKSNTMSELKKVSIHKFHPIENADNFNQCGFKSVKLQSVLKPIEFENEQKVKDFYYPEIVDLLRSAYPHAVEIRILEHQIRKRHPEFPIATGETYENLLPATIAHIDYTNDSAIRTSFSAFKDLSERYSRLLTVNLWKSLQGPGNDWPLALCDPRTVDHATQVIGQDVVYHDRFNENARLFHSALHRWYYFEDLGTDEAILFRQTDSDDPEGGGVPHASFFNPRAAKDAAPRVSIEVRAFIYFE